MAAIAPTHSRSSSIVVYRNEPYEGPGWVPPTQEGLEGSAKTDLYYKLAMELDFWPADSTRYIKLRNRHPEAPHELILKAMGFSLKDHKEGQRPQELIFPANFSDSELFFDLFAESVFLDPDLSRIDIAYHIAWGTNYLTATPQEVVGAINKSKMLIVNARSLVALLPPGFPVPKVEADISLPDDSTPIVALESKDNESEAEDPIKKTARRQAELEADYRLNPIQILRFLGYQREHPKASEKTILKAMGMVVDSHKSTRGYEVPRHQRGYPVLMEAFPYLMDRNNANFRDELYAQSVFFKPDICYELALRFATLGCMFLTPKEVVAFANGIELSRKVESCIFRFGQCLKV